MKKILAFFMILAALTTMFTGCTPKNKDNGNSNEGNKEKQVVIRYLTFSANPDHIEDLKEMISIFEAENEGVKIEYEAIGWNDYFIKLQTYVASGKAPDTFELNYENFITYGAKNALLDMEDLIKNDKTFDTSIFNEAAFKAFKYNNKQYGLVQSFSNVVLLYNKKIFDEAGLEYPNEAWTWKEELEAAQKLTNLEKGIWGTFAPIQFHEFYKTIEQNGGSIFNEDKTEVTIDSKENIEALQWMIDKINKYKVTPSDAQMGGQLSEDLFEDGKIAMLRIGTWMFDRYKDLDFDWDITLEPGNKQKAHHFFSNGVVISKNTKNVEAAWKWVKFLTANKKSASIRVNSSWELPAITDKELLNEYLMKKPPENREIVFKALDTLVVPPVIEEWNELTDIIGMELEYAKLGEKTAEQALKDAKAKVEKLIKINAFKP